MKLHNGGNIKWLILAILLFRTGLTLAETNTTASFEYSVSDVANNLVHIHCESRGIKTYGCGFIGQMGGKLYLFTSQHLILGTDKIRFVSPNGRPLKPRSVELAYSRDIARLALPEGEGFTISKRPSMGDLIGIFSSSMDSQTARYGTITGVGADIVEVSADFKSEHSGSPVLTPEKEVIGIASFVQKPRNHAMKKGTKFENQIRRFCYRLDRADWKPVKWKRYNEKYGTLYRESQSLTDSIISILNRWVDEPLDPVRFESNLEPVLSSWMHTHNQLVKQSGASGTFQRKFYAEYSESTQDLAEMCRKRARKIRMISKQRDLTAFLLKEFNMQADTLDAAAKIIDRYSTNIY